jgi:hypothetical protein
VIDDPKKLLLRVSKAIYDVVAETDGGEGGDGTPETPVFLAMAEQGCTEAYYEQLLEALESLGVIRRDPQLHRLWADRLTAQRLGFA